MRDQVKSFFRLAVERGRTEAFRSLLELQTVSRQDNALAVRHAVAAGDVSLAKLLLEHARKAGYPLSLNQRLCQAIRLGRPDIARLLLREGANPSIRDYGGLSALALAVRSNEAELARELLALGADATGVDRCGRTLAELAAAHASVDLLQTVIHAGSPLNGALRQAAMNNRYAHVRMLILYGADVNEANEAGITPLIFSILHGNPRIIRLLVRFGADLDARTAQGETALSYAFRNGRTNAYRLLLRLGASEDAGFPLDEAVRDHKPRLIINCSDSN